MPFKTFTTKILQQKMKVQRESSYAAFSYETFGPIMMIVDARCIRPEHCEYRPAVERLDECGARASEAQPLCGWGGRRCGDTVPWSARQRSAETTLP